MFINDSFAETIDLNVADFVIHKHTPYVIILLKVADKWAKTHGGSLPSTREEKKEFKELIRARMKAMDEDNYEEVVEASFKVFAPRGISSNLQRIINDSRADVDSNSSDFWVMVATLKVHNNLASVTQVIDPKLHQHLETLGGGDYLFAFRMLMVLFRREFSFGDSLYLWEVWNYHFGEDNG